MPHASKGLPKNGSLGGLTERVAEFQYRIGGLSWACTIRSGGAGSGC
jgi:hypothetical protein